MSNGKLESELNTLCKPQFGFFLDVLITAPAGIATQAYQVENPTRIRSHRILPNKIPEIVDIIRYLSGSMTTSLPTVTTGSLLDRKLLH